MHGHWLKGYLNEGRDNNGGGGGSGGGILLVNTFDNVLDKTWQEINDAPYSVLVESVSEGANGRAFYPIDSVAIVEEAGGELEMPPYIVSFDGGDSVKRFYASSPSDYPSNSPGLN